MKIIVAERSQDFYAYLEGFPEKWGAGSTPDAAIGALLLDHANFLGIELESPQQWEPKQPIIVRPGDTRSALERRLEPVLADGLRQAIEKAAGELPDEYRLEIHAERGYAGVCLIDPGGNGTSGGWEHEEDLADQVLEALEAAKRGVKPSTPSTTPKPVGPIHICHTEALPEELLTNKTTYDELKALVLEAGRFSCFEASSRPHIARLFDQLCKDPDIQTTDQGYPWTGVALKLEPCRCGQPARYVRGERGTGEGLSRDSIHCSAKCGAEVIGDHWAEVKRKWAALCTCEVT